MPEALHDRRININPMPDALPQPPQNDASPGLTGRLRSAARAMAEMLLPQQCMLCGLSSGNSPVCSECAASFPGLIGPCCPRCALPLTTSPSIDCPDCHHHQPSFDSATAVWSYAFPIDQLIRDFKYGHHLYLADFFGGYLGAALQRQWQSHHGIAPDLVLPMPLHPNRLKTRGFNQAAEIARHTARRLHLPWSTEHLVRLHDTPAQAGLRREARWSNLQGAFACPTSLSGLRILLIDDVLTTGASLSACADVLRHAGASRVDVAVMARTPEPNHLIAAQSNE